MIALLWFGEKPIQTDWIFNCMRTIELQVSPSRFEVDVSRLSQTFFDLAPSLLNACSALYIPSVVAA